MSLGIVRRSSTMAVPDISRPRTTSTDCSQLPNDHQTTFEDLVMSPLPHTTNFYSRSLPAVLYTSTEFTDLSGPYQTSHRAFPTSHRTYATFPDLQGWERSASKSAKCDQGFTNPLRFVQAVHFHVRQPQSY